MAIEIERKFLVLGQAWRDQAQQSKTIRQGFLGGSRCSVRVRISGDQASLNIKSLEMGIQRMEYEYPIAMDDAGEMLDKLCNGPLIEKTRHLVVLGELTWEIDEFSGENAGLIVAEVELQHPDQAFEHPPWLGREVSDDGRYYNINLASHPYSQWRDSE
jgi:adenylate cyclase